MGPPRPKVFSGAEVCEKLPAFVTGGNLNLLQAAGPFQDTSCITDNKQPLDSMRARERTLNVASWRSFTNGPYVNRKRAPSVPWTEWHSVLRNSHRDRGGLSQYHVSYHIAIWERPWPVRGSSDQRGGAVTPIAPDRFIGSIIPIAVHRKAGKDAPIP
jgi:hypothetical protein